MKRRIRISWSLGLFLLVGLISSCGPRITGGVVKNVPTDLSSDWLSIELPEPVTAKWDVQLIYVDVSSRFQFSYDPPGIRLEGGGVGTPEVELINKTGLTQTFQLASVASGGFVFRNDRIARGSRFSRLRIRSPIPLVCSRIRWISYMPQDSKYPPGS